MFWNRPDQFDIAYESLCLNHTSKDNRVSEAASLLVLARTGVVVENSTIADIADRLATFALETGLSPDEVQAALLLQEPVLEQEWI